MLPVEVHIGKMLVLGTILGCSNIILTIAAALSVQSPFLRVVSGGDSGTVASARREIESAEGDPFTLLLLFEQWIRIKDQIRAGRKSISSRKWCLARGVEEQRLYEMAKLKRQFEDLLRSGGIAAPAPGRGGRDGGQHRQRPAASHPGVEQEQLDRRSRGKTWLREQQRRHEKQSRMRRVLRADGGGYGDEEEGGDEEGVGSASFGRRASKRSRREREAEASSALDGEALKQLDLELTVDVSSLASVAAKDCTPGDISLLKCIVAAALYPNLAVPAVGNMHKRDADMRFHLHSGGDASLHPSSCLAPHTREMASHHLIAYAEALETRSLFLCNNMPVPALGALFLNGSRVNTACALLLSGHFLLSSSVPTTTTFSSSSPLPPLPLLLHHLPPLSPSPPLFRASPSSLRRFLLLPLSSPVPLPDPRRMLMLLPLLPLYAFCPPLLFIFYSAMSPTHFALPVVPRHPPASPFLFPFRSLLSPAFIFRRHFPPRLLPFLSPSPSLSLPLPLPAPPAAAMCYKTCLSCSPSSPSCLSFSTCFSA